MMRAGRRLGNVLNHEKFGKDGKYYDNLNSEREERLREMEAKRLEEEKKRKEEEARRMEEWRRHRFSRVRTVVKPVPLSEETQKQVNPLMNLKIRKGDKQLFYINMLLDVIIYFSFSKGIERVLQNNKIAGKELSEFESQALRDFYDQTGELSELMQKYLQTRTYDFIMEKEKQEHLDRILAVLKYSFKKQLKYIFIKISYSLNS
jgi:predicted Holliday junction resolvase-like endonuclease